MTSPHASFRERLLRGDFLVGTFVKTPSMMLAEVLAQTELDVMCVDAEHAPFDRRDIDACVMAYRAANKPAVVRVQSCAAEHMLNALDCGATGVVVPHVDSADKAREVARLARYGDRGRGYAGSSRAAGYGGNSMTENLRSSRDDTVVVAQIEDVAAVDCIDDIAAVDGIDALFIGMMDLTVALGALSASDPVVEAAAQKVCAAAVKANRRLGIFVPDIAQVPVWRERGVSLFLLQSDHAFVKAGATKLGTAARAAAQADRKQA